jgi:hypothetical protein
LLIDPIDAFACPPFSQHPIALNRQTLKYRREYCSDGYGCDECDRAVYDDSKSVGREESEVESETGDFDKSHSERVDHLDDPKYL